MASKKERNQERKQEKDLIEIENYCRTNFPKSLVRKGEKTNFRQNAKRFSIKIGNYITKRADLSLQIRIAKSTLFMISTTGQAILVTQKQCQLILGEPLHTKNVGVLPRCCGLHTKM